MDDKPHRAEPAWPIVGVKDHAAPSVFRPESLLREARRQRRLPLVAVHEGWACYHTELLAFDLDGVGEVGIVGCAVGAPFAVLVAEQLFASGCRLLISVTSADQTTPIGPHAIVLTVNHIRPYRWCGPPSIGRQTIFPTHSTPRGTGASLFGDK